MKLLFQVDGIRCSSCVAKIEKISELDSRIFEARVYLPQNLLELDVPDTPQAPSAEEIKKLVNRIGFSARFIQDQSQNFEADKMANRRRINQLGVAAFSAGNTMLFAASIYAGADGEFRALFSYLSFLTFLPLVFYSAIDIHKSAWAALRLRTLNIDLPISIALLSGFLFSTYNLVLNQFDYLYFDSTASFIFLILFSRFVLEKLKQNYISYEGLFNKNINDKYLVKSQSNISEKKYLEIQPSDVLVMTSGSILPVDAELIGGTTTVCEIDKRHLTGESLPVVVHAGVKVTAGSCVLTQGCEFKALSSYRDSSISKMDQLLAEAQKAKGQYITLSDKASHYLILTVFLIAGAFFAYYSQIDTMEAFQRSLALLIVACPCALALGTPLSYLFAVRAAAKDGILVKANDVFDKLSDVKNLFLDKTGTLTTGRLSIVQVDGHANDEIKNLILNLESKSQHPIAEAIRSAWSTYYCELNLTHLLEVPGVGVAAEWNGKKIQFNKNTNSEKGLSSTLFIDGQVICTLYFEDTFVQESTSALQSVASRFDAIFLISGDSKDETLKIAKKCLIPESNVIYNANPKDKYEMVKKHSPALMIGDGANDALALQGAEVGIAVSGAIDKSLQSAEVYFLNPGIGQLVRFLDLSQRLRQTIQSNLLISFSYNALAGFAALCGYMNPLFAAVLMPISSLIIIFNSKWRFS